MRFPYFFCGLFFSVGMASSVLGQGLRIDLDGGVLDLGQGYDSALREPRGFCVDSEFDLHSLRTPSVAGEVLGDSQPAQRVSYSLQFMDAEDFRSEFESLSVSASGSFAGFGASGSSTTEREFERTEFNLFVVLTVDVSIQVLGGDIHTIPEEVATTNNTGGVTVDTRRCGDYFVAAVGLGGRLDLIARINTLSQSERESLRTSLNAGGDFGSFGVDVSGNFTSIVQTALERRDVFVEIQTSGPWFGDEAFDGLTLGPQFDIATVDDLRQLVNVAMLFPDAVAARPWPYVGYLLDYEAVGYDAPNPIRQALNRARFAELETALERYNLSLDRLSAAIENPDIFEAKGPDNNPIQSASLLELLRADATRLSEAREQLRTALSSCYQILLDGQEECVALSDLTVGSETVNPVPSYSFGSLSLVVESREAELCDEESSFVFLRLVPVNGGCIDPETSLVWSNPRFFIEADVAEYFCDQRSTGSGRSWRLPTELELRFLASGTELARLARVQTAESPVVRLLSDESGDGPPLATESEVWIWAVESPGAAVSRIVNLARATADGVNPNDGALYTAICVASLTETSDAVEEQDEI